MLDLDRCGDLLARLPIQHIKTGQMVPFVPNFNQWLLKQRIKEHQKRIGGKIRFVSVKARRVGVSSITDAWGVCHIAERENALGWIVACLGETAQELFRVPSDLVLNWPFPLPKPLSTEICYPHKGGDSYLTIATAKSIIAGRGPTLSFLHLSEAAYYPGGKSFMSLLPSVSDDPGTIIGVESTAAGKTGPGETFWNFWDAAARGDSEYLAVFLTYLDDPSCRREPDGLTLAMADSDERDLIALVACPAKCGGCEKCRKALECIAWRRWAIINISQGKVDDFRREYPITAEEAFYSTSYPAFTRDEKRIARGHIKEPIAIGRLETDIDSFGTSGTGRPKFVHDSRGALRIWAWPVEKYHYYAGTDAARGQGGDYSATAVYCGETGEQVASFASRHIDSESLAKVMYMLCIFYSYAMANIELTGNLGLWVQKVLRDTYKYRNIYRWRGRDDRTPGPRIIGSLGWETTSRTRDLMLSAFRSGIHHGKCLPRDAALYTQMDAAEMVDGRWEVPESIHDDLLVANMIAWIAKEQWYTGYKGAESKNLIGEELGTVDDVEDVTKEIAKAKGDVDAAVKAHWAKMRLTIKTAGSGLVLVGQGEGTRLIDRLRGI